MTSCGSTWEVSSPSYQTGPCSVATYQFGSYGWGFYDCFGLPAGPGYYSNYGYNYGPRIILRPSNAVRSSSRRGDATNKGSSGRRNRTNSRQQ